MAQSCGECHKELETEIVAAAPLPPTGDALIDKMKRHKWASNRLWAGLVGPSDEAWKSGAEVLAELPINTKDIAADKTQRRRRSGVQCQETRHRRGCSRRARGPRQALWRATCHLLRLPRAGAPEKVTTTDRPRSFPRTARCPTACIHRCHRSRRHLGMPEPC